MITNYHTYYTYHILPRIPHTTTQLWCMVVVWCGVVGVVALFGGTPGNGVPGARMLSGQANHG